MTTQMISYTAEEIEKISKLSPKAQKLSKDPKYFSYFQNYCDHFDLPELSEDSKIDWAEFYYDHADNPQVFFTNGALTSISVEEIEDPTSLEIVGLEGSLFIQVAGEVILNRIGKSQLPSWVPKDKLAVVKEFVV